MQTYPYSQRQEKPDPPVPRADWFANHMKVETAFIEFVAANKKCPNQKELAAASGMSRATIRAHFKSLDLSKVMEPYKALAGRVILGQASAGMKGNPFAAKLYFQLAFGWKEGMTLDVPQIKDLDQSNLSDDDFEKIANIYFEARGRKEENTPSIEIDCTVIPEEKPAPLITKE